MEPDYFDIMQEDRFMGLNGFYDPSEEGVDFCGDCYEEDEEEYEVQ